MCTCTCTCTVGYFRGGLYPTYSCTRHIGGHYMLGLGHSDKLHLLSEAWQETSVLYNIY